MLVNLVDTRFSDVGFVVRVASRTRHRNQCVIGEDFSDANRIVMAIGILEQNKRSALTQVSQLTMEDLVVEISRTASVGL